jgi:hypothetical protein
MNKKIEDNKNKTELKKEPIKAQKSSSKESQFKKKKKVKRNITSGIA